MSRQADPIDAAKIIGADWFAFAINHQPSLVRQIDRRVADRHQQPMPVAVAFNRMRDFRCAERLGRIAGQNLKNGVSQRGWQVFRIGRCHSLAMTDRAGRDKLFRHGPIRIGIKLPPPHHHDHGRGTCE